MPWQRVVDFHKLFSKRPAGQSIPLAARSVPSQDSNGRAPPLASQSQVPQRPQTSGPNQHVNGRPTPSRAQNFTGTTNGLHHSRSSSNAATSQLTPTQPNPSQAQVNIVPFRRSIVSSQNLMHIIAVLGLISTIIFFCMTYRQQERVNSRDNNRETWRDCQDRPVRQRLVFMTSTLG